MSQVQIKMMTFLHMDFIILMMFNSDRPAVQTSLILASNTFIMGFTV